MSPMSIVAGKSRADELIQRLDLKAHPEGGHYKEVFRSGHAVQSKRGERSALTTIYYLLQQGEYGRWHVVASDEVWHFYEGEPLELLAFDPQTEELTRTVLDAPSDTSASVQVVPANHWQAARPLGEYTLVGCTVAPGFEFSDFRFVSDVPEHQPAFSAALADYQSLL